VISNDLIFARVVSKFFVFKFGIGVFYVYFYKNCPTASTQLLGLVLSGGGGDEAGRFRLDSSRV
jgi:hypothetical protein